MRIHPPAIEIFTLRQRQQKYKKQTQITRAATTITTTHKSNITKWLCEFDIFDLLSLRKNNKQHKWKKTLKIAYFQRFYKLYYTHTSYTLLLLWKCSAEFRNFVRKNVEQTNKQTKISSVLEIMLSTRKKNRGKKENYLISFWINFSSAFCFILFPFENENKHMHWI